MLKKFKGIGDASADIYLREVQDVWTWVRPYFDDRAIDTARKLGLPGKAAKLESLAPHASSRLAAALVRASLDKDLCRRMTGLTIRIGTSGWFYDHWADVLYPPRTASARRLDYYAQVFDTVELNASFYRWPKDSTFAGWRDQLPTGVHHVGQGPPLAHSLSPAVLPRTVDRAIRAVLAAAGRPARRAARPAASGTAA